MWKLAFCSCKRSVKIVVGCCFLCTQKGGKRQTEKSKQLILNSCNLQAYYTKALIKKIQYADGDPSSWHMF